MLVFRIFYLSFMNKVFQTFSSLFFFVMREQQELKDGSFVLLF